MKPQKTSEIIISSKRNDTLFEKISRILKDEFKVSFTQKIDGINQKYWDFKIDNFQLTLHSEHYLGISIFGPESKEVDEILSQIKNKLNSLLSY